MSIKPILFNADMVRAILEGRKAVTRRVVKPQPKDGFTPVWRGNWDGTIGSRPAWAVMPLYQPGDILYVRETWARTSEAEILAGEDKNKYFYKSDVSHLLVVPRKWHPSIHMPKDAARLFLRVTDVRVERLQTSFTEPICPILELQSEGIDIGETCLQCIENYGEPCCVDTVDEDGSDEPECGVLDEVRDDFARLWDSTIKPADIATYGWAANPWVWVIQFERCRKPEVQA